MTGIDIPWALIVAITKNIYNVKGSEAGKSETALKKNCLRPLYRPTHPKKPYLQNPTSCGVPLSSSIEVLSYDEGLSFGSAPWPATTGCEQLSFNPSLSAVPTTAATDSASGLEVDLRVPQQESPSVPSPSELRENVVMLPEGLTLNPSAADGKVACSEKEAAIGTLEEAHCPERSTIGSVTVESSALPGPLQGRIYIGESKPGQRFRLFVAANGFNTHLKLIGVIRLDPETGQQSVFFENLPQSPLTEFNLHFFGSELGVLATATQCGRYPVKSTFVPWDSSLSAQNSVQMFELSSGPQGASCPPATRAFDPKFDAGYRSSAPGAHTTFSLQVDRADGEQNLAALKVKMPEGLLATLKSVPYCSDAAIVVASALGRSGLEEEQQPSCPEASEVGSAVTGAGAGSNPVYVDGKVYLAGPYKGAALSLVVITPVVSGPYDLGDSVVRVALQINPETTQIAAVSDPLPSILEGVPLRLREIRVDIDRASFILNPTNCESSSVVAEILGNQGGTSVSQEPFQVANCSSLPFTPKLAVGLSGSMKRASNPRLEANLTASGGEANIQSTVVALPSSELIDNAHIKNPCTRVQFAAKQCPPGSIVGFARAETPLLSGSLEGPVYLRSSTNSSGLPNLVAALNGQIDVDLVGKIETVDQRLTTTFASVPDAPVSKFTLTLDGGKRGLLQNSVDLCRTTRSVDVSLTGQNEKGITRRENLLTPCNKTALRHTKEPHDKSRAGRR